MTTLESLESRTGSKWEHLRIARQNSGSECMKITEALDTFSTADASIVVDGSLARKECTPGSDVDWTLLLDGMSRPQDEQLARNICQDLERIGRKQPE